MASLDFDAPLLSVRRVRAAPISPSPAATRFPLPSYKSYFNSGPVRKPGLVPFSWEHTPGLPKHGPSPATPPPATTAIDGNSDDATSSSGSSPFMNCSACGSHDDGDDAAGTLATDAEVRDFMMARFLPAARAMAACCESRKPHRGPADASGEEEGPRPLYRQRTESIIPWHANEEASSSSHVDEEDEAGAGVGEAYADDIANLLSKSCGLIPAFCFKSSFSLPKTAPAAMSASSRLESLSQSEDENLWEAHWTDPQLRNGSSSFSRSATSPYRNETPRSAFVEGKAFLGFPKSELEIRKTASFNSVESYATNNYWAIANSNGRQHSSDSMSPETDKALSVYSLHKPCATDAKLEFADKEATEEKNQALVVCEKDSAQPQFSEFVDSERSICNADDQEATLSMLLLPPPLPKSPSESWLRRTLPTVSAKDRFPQSRFAVQFQPKKQSFRGFSTDVKLETKANSPIF